MVTLTASSELDIGDKGKIFGQPLSKYPSKRVLPDLSGELLRQMTTGVPLARVALDVKDDNFTYILE